MIARRRDRRARARSTLLAADRAGLDLRGRSATPRASSSAAGSDAASSSATARGCKITHERLEQVEGYFDRHGGKTILIGRFIGLVRALAPFIAGSSGLRYRRFIPYSIVGTGLWATLFCVLGYVFWRSFDKVATRRRAGDLRLRRDGRRDRRRRGRLPAPRARSGAVAARPPAPPAAAAAVRVGAAAPPALVRAGRRSSAPELRFLWDRLTPGRARARADHRAGGRRGRRSTCSSLYVVDRCPATTGAHAARPRVPRPRPADVRTAALTDVAKVVTESRLASGLSPRSWSPRAAFSPAAADLAEVAPARPRLRSDLRSASTSRRG